MSATPAEAFAALERDFAAARARVGAVDHFYGIGPHVARISFLGDEPIARLTPALAHRRLDSTERVDLRIGVWSAETSGAEESCTSTLGSARAVAAGPIRLACRSRVNASPLSTLRNGDAVSHAGTAPAAGRSPPRRQG